MTRGCGLSWQFTVDEIDDAASREKPCMHCHAKVRLHSPAIAQAKTHTRLVYRNLLAARTSFPQQPVRNMSSRRYCHCRESRIPSSGTWPSRADTGRLGERLSWEQDAGLLFQREHALAQDAHRRIGVALYDRRPHALSSTATTGTLNSQASAPSKCLIHGISVARLSLLPGTPIPAGRYAAPGH